jgi:hypothetical protein
MFIAVEPHMEGNCVFCKLSLQDWETFFNINVNVGGKRKMKNDESFYRETAASKRSAPCLNKNKPSENDLFPGILLASNAVYSTPQSDCFSQPCLEGTSYQHWTSTEHTFGQNQSPVSTTTLPSLIDFTAFNVTPEFNNSPQVQNFEMGNHSTGFVENQPSGEFGFGHFPQPTYYNPNPVEVINEDPYFIPETLETDSFSRSPAWKMICKSVSPDSGISSFHSSPEIGDIEPQVQNSKGEEEFFNQEDCDWDSAEFEEILMIPSTLSGFPSSREIEELLFKDNSSFQTPDSKNSFESNPKLFDSVMDGADKAEHVFTDGIGISPVSESSTRLHINPILSNPFSEPRRLRRLANENKKGNQFGSLAAIFGCILVALIFRFFIF